MDAAVEAIWHYPSSNQCGDTLAWIAWRSQGTVGLRIATVLRGSKTLLGTGMRQSAKEPNVIRIRRNDV